MGIKCTLSVIRFTMSTSTVWKPVRVYANTRATLSLSLTLSRSLLKFSDFTLQTQPKPLDAE